MQQSATQSKPAASRVPYQGREDAAAKLMNIQAAEVLVRPVIAAGAVTQAGRTQYGYVEMTDARFMSQHNPGGTGSLNIGLGWLKALDAFLTGGLVEIGAIGLNVPAADRTYGIARFRSLSDTAAQYVYSAQWSIETVSPAYPLKSLVCGGQVNGATYQSALLVLCFYVSGGGGPPADQLFKRLGELLKYLRAGETPDPTHPISGAWSKAQLVSLYRNMSFRESVTGLADCLRRTFERQFTVHGPDSHGPFVQYDPLDQRGWLPLDVTMTLSQIQDALIAGVRTAPLQPPITAPASNLAPPTGAAYTAVGSWGAQTTPIAASDPDVDMDIEDDAPAAASPTPTVPDPTQVTQPPFVLPTKVPVPTLSGPLYEMVKRGVFRDGPYFVVGDTAGGKSTMMMAAAMSWVDADHVHGPGRLQVITCDNLLKSTEVVGVMVPSPPGEEWWRDGEALEIFRWLLKENKRVALQFEELPRAHQSVASAVMRIMETVSSSVVAKRGLTITIEDPGDRYHVFRVTDKAETLVIPASLLKLLATGNTGDGYHQTLNTQDPAFRRRWRAGFKYISEPDRGDMATIIASHLGLAPSHILIVSMLDVHQAIKEYQGKDQSLVMVTNMDLLINWGRVTLETAITANAGAAVGTTRGAVQAGLPDLRVPFVVAAIDLWIDMLVPMKGNQPDKDIESNMLQIVQQHAP